MDETLYASKPASARMVTARSSGWALAILLIGFAGAQSEIPIAKGQAPGPSVEPPPAQQPLQKPVQKPGQEPAPEEDSVPEASEVGKAGEDSSRSEDEVAVAVRVDYADDTDDTDDAEADGDEGSEHPLWMDTYGEGVYSRHDNRNLSGFTEFKIGKRLNLPMPADFYLKTRLYRDQRDFFWNNRADIGVGARIPLLKKVSLQVFGEVIGGQYLRLASGTLGFEGMQAHVERNRAAINAAEQQFQAMYKEIFQANLLKDKVIDRQTLVGLETSADAHIQALSRLNSHLDSLETSQDSMSSVMDSMALIPAGTLREYRAGLIFWYGWGQNTAELEGPGTRFSFPMRFWGETYSDLIFSSLSRHVRTRGGGETYKDSVARFGNLIFYVNPAAGMVVMEGLAGTLAAYATGYVWFDTHKDWWNNLAMAGPGLRYKPLGVLDLVFKAEYLFGRYYGRERAEDPNPYPRNLQDLRITGSFWYGMGI